MRILEHKGIKEIRTSYKAIILGKWLNRMIIKNLVPIFSVYLITCFSSLFTYQYVFCGDISTESSWGNGNNYYVAPNGSDGNNGSLNRPWATVNHGGGKAKPGDTVFIRGGIYNEGEIWLRADYGHGGTQGKLLTIKAYPGEKPTFVNGNRPFIIECDYIRVEGLHFTNGKGISVRGLNRNTIQIKNNSFTGSGYAWGAVDCQGNNILIEGNECNLKGNIVGTQGHCYYVSHGTNVIVRDNIAKGATGYGIHIFDQRRSEDPPSFERLIRNVLVEGNVIADSEQRSGIVIAAYDHASIENVIVRNNVIFNNAYFGIFVPGLAQNIKIYSNTIFGNKVGTAVYIKGKNNEVRNLRITNNILDVSGVQVGSPLLFHVISEDHNSEVVLGNNLYWPKPVRLKNVVDSNPIIGDPLFVNIKSGDFHLKEGSAAIDEGIFLEDVPKDRDGISRPQNSAFDIGAYEYH